MAQFTGMDIAAVRQLSQQLTAKAGEIQTIMSTLTNQLQSTPWVGPDREKFLSDWQSQHVAALTRVKEGLEGAAQLATKNANEQEQASGG